MLSILESERKSPEPARLYFSMLYWAVLFCTSMHSPVLSYTVLYCFVLLFTLLYSSVLFCTILHFVILRSAVLYWATKVCKTPFKFHSKWWVILVRYMMVLLYYMMAYRLTLYDVLYCYIPCSPPFWGAQAPLGIARVKNRKAKVSNSNNFLSPASASTLIVDTWY